MAVRMQWIALLMQVTCTYGRIRVIRLLDTNTCARSNLFLYMYMDQQVEAAVKAPLDDTAALEPW